MTMRAAIRRVKKSYTLTPEAVAFLSETRKKQRAGSDSEALDLLLRELKLEAKRNEIDLAFKAYYDSASEQELTEQREWAEMAGPNVLVDPGPHQAQP